MADGKWQNRPPRSHEKFAQFEHTFTHSSTRSFVQSKNREAMGKVLIRTPPSGRGNFCPMTLGFEDFPGAVVLVPEGYPRIAQRFSVGSTHRNGISPEGTAEPCRASAVPSGRALAKPATMWVEVPPGEFDCSRRKNGLGAVAARPKRKHWADRTGRPQ